MNTAERLARTFEQKYPGIGVRVERSGAERIFQRIARRNRAAASMPSTSPIPQARALSRLEEERLAHRGLCARRSRRSSGRPDRSGRHLRDVLRLVRGVIGYNTEQVKAEDAPKSYADLLDPKWRGKIVKGHPGYSGAIMTATFVLARDLGWPYLEKLAQHCVMQGAVGGRSAKKILLGERAVMADGNDYNLVLAKDQGKPVEVVYPIEGAPLIIVPSGIFKGAPDRMRPGCSRASSSAPRPSRCWPTNSPTRSFHAKVKEKAGHVPLDRLKMLKANPAQVRARSEEIKAKIRQAVQV